MAQRHISSIEVARNLQAFAKTEAAKTGKSADAIYAYVTKVHDWTVLGMDDGRFSDPFSPPAARQTAHPFS